MSGHRPHRIDRAAAEQMLRGGPVDPVAGAEELLDLLAAAARPAAPGQLAGENAAAAAFLQARLVTLTQQRRGSMIKTALAKLLTLKVAAVALTATAIGGAAVAATTDTLPAQLGGNGSAADTAPAHSTGKPSTASGADAGTKASPSPSLVGLCHAYTAGVANSKGKALENPAFRALVTAAGDEDKVSGYCSGLLAGTDAKAGASADKSDARTTGRPTTDPGGEADSHTTAKPDSVATGKPTTDPGGEADSHTTVKPDSTGKPMEVPSH